MTIETLTHDRRRFDESEFTGDPTGLPGAGDIGSTEHQSRTDEDEVDALCRNALARFAEALRKAVLD